MTDFIVNRFPSRQSLLGTYAVVAALLYSWTLGTSFYRLPAWLYYLSPSQIAALYAYAFPINFLESLLAFGALIVLHYTAFLFFKNAEEFQARSILTALILLVSAGARLILYKEYIDSAAFLNSQASWWAATLVAAVPLIVFAPFSAKFRAVAADLAERAVVFLYLYLPLTAAALIVIVARNLS